MTLFVFGYRMNVISDIHHFHTLRTQTALNGAVASP